MRVALAYAERRGISLDQALDTPLAEIELWASYWQSLAERQRAPDWVDHRTMTILEQWRRDHDQP